MKRKVTKMALLTIKTRKAWFKKLGLGEYNKANILKFQKKYFVRKSDWDGIYGSDTDKLLRHVHHVKTYMPSFKPSEFRCPCGRCTGYPTWLRVNEAKHVQTIRSHYGKPMKVTSGLRCEYENSRLSGSSRSSAHMKGKAVDFYMAGVTDTEAHRRAAISYIKRLKHHNYTYGNGISSTGARVNAPNMGNAMHTEVR